MLFYFFRFRYPFTPNFILCFAGKIYICIEDSLIEDVSKKYPQPTEASYKAYKAAHPEESSSTTEKTEM